MANDVKFEGKERRMAKIEKFLADNQLGSMEDAGISACPRGLTWSRSSRACSHCV